MEKVNEQYDNMDSEGPTVEPEALKEAFPPADSRDELNIADVLSTCNLIFRDA